jgi:carbamoyl-phosphate synthase large subunit
MIKVLVSGVGGDVGQGVIKCLNKSALELEIYKISSSADDSWLYIDENSYISPSIYDNYVPYLIDFIKEHTIDIFFPCIDLEIPIMAKNKHSIEEKTGCIVFVGEPHKIHICNDKYMTARFLKDFDLPYPSTSLVKDNEYDLFPLIIKTREGCGSKDIHKVTNKDEILPFVGDNDYIAQEYLKGDEYTAGIYLGDDQEIKGICVLKRKLKDGSTYTAERIKNPEYEKTLIQLAKSLGLKYINVQFRLKNGSVCPFELNGRFSGTTGIISKVFNAPEMAIREKILNEKIEPAPNDEAFYVMRFYDEIYASETQRQELINRRIYD